MNESPNSRPADASELDWLAFRYVAGECDPAESLEFELLLAEDQSAREAVARAVELSQACALACGAEVKPARAEATWRLPVVWTSCGAAAALVIVALVRSLWPTTDLPHLPVDPALAVEWSESVQSHTGPLLEEHESNYLAEFSVDSDPSYEAPSWLLAAVASESMSPGEMDEMPAPTTPDEG